MKKILFALLCSLILVGSANADTYVVKSGDTLYKIGKSFGVSYETIAEDNGITNPNLILVGQRLQVEKKLGYTPVTDYSSRTTQYISATATTIPVASTKDSAGNQIVLSNISTSGTVKVYLNIEPGGTNVEPVICTGLTTTSWTNCSRGIAFQGSSEVASSSLAKPHNAGSKIIITNIGQFYNQYVSVDGNQQVNDLKTFSSGQIGFTGTRKIIDNGTNLGWTDNGVDTYTFAAGGSGLTASSTKGIGITDSKIYVNASSTTGMSFDANGALYQKINSSSGVEYASGSAGIGINTSTLVSLIATSTPTAGKIVETGATQYIDNGWLEYPNATTQFNAGEVMDGTVTPVAVYLNATDGELYKADADYNDERRQVMGFVVNSTSDGLPAKLVTSGILTIPYQATTTTVASQADQSMGIKAHNAITINSASDSPAWIIQAGQDTGNISSFVMNFTDVGGGNNTYRADIYAVDANNAPTGSALASSGTVASTPGDKTFTFATPYELTPGQKYAVVLVVTNYVGINQIGGANATTDNYAVLGSGATMYYSDNGGAWTQNTNCYFKTYTTQLKYPYGSGVFLSSTAGGYSLTGTVKIGELLSPTRMLIASVKESYLGSISATDLGDQTAYLSVPPKTNRIIGTGTAGSGVKQSIIMNKEKTTSFVSYYDASLYRVDLTWSGNILIWETGNDLTPDDITLYFYSY